MKQNLFESIFKDLKISKAKNYETNRTKKLMQPVFKDKGLNMPKVTTYKEDAEHTADLLMLPNDNGYKYALVCVDSATREADAEPLKSKTPVEVLEAIKKIWKRKYLNHPNFVLKVDNGTEFKGQFKQELNDMGIRLKLGRPNRHRQQALAEYLNYIIGKSLFSRMNSEELKTGVTTKKWVADLPKVIKAYNKYVDSKNIHPEDILKLKPHFNEPFLELKTKVRIPLDYPQDINGKKLGDKFRAGDIRWDPKTREITDIFINPGQPVTYRVTGISDTAYTRKQLQLVENETKDRKRTYNNEYYVVEKLIKKEKRNNKIFFLVKWKGYSNKHNTWEPRSKLIQDVPDLVRKFTDT